MANSKKLRKAVAKFRKTEPHLHAIISTALGLMANSIRANGPSEVTAAIHNNNKIEIYANE